MRAYLERHGLIFLCVVVCDANKFLLQGPFFSVASACRV